MDPDDDIFISDTSDLYVYCVHCERDITLDRQEECDTGWCCLDCSGD